jgi:GT2 family glycosyltransferase
MIDVIFLSNTKTIEHYGYTTRAINTLRFSEPNIKFNEIVVETNPEYLNQGFCYNGSKVIIPNEEFNYNRFLNHGLKHSTADWVVVSNNDVIFTKNWFTKLIQFQKEHPEFLSLSPYEPNWHKSKNMSNNVEFYTGYRTSFEITGWCLVINKQVIKQCNLFDEQFKFWYQDNDYAETLKSQNIKHALVTNSRVYHDVSKSMNTVSNEILHEMTHAQSQIFHNKWTHNK